jgi:hypothetical protein
MQKINEAYEKLQRFFDNPDDYKSNKPEDSKKSKTETTNQSDAKMNSGRKTEKEKEPKNSRISEAVIQAKFDKNSTLNSSSFGWSAIFGAVLVIAWNILRWMPFLKSTP